MIAPLHTIRQQKKEKNEEPINPIYIVIISLLQTVKEKQQQLM